MNTASARFGKRVRELRTKQGMTKEELSRRSGISRQRIRLLEMKDPDHRVTLETAEKIAAALGVPMWQLLKG